MKNYSTLLIAIALLVVPASSQAVIVTYGAQQANGFGNAAGDGLLGVRIEVGTYTIGNVASFNLLGAGTIDGFGGLFPGNTANATNNVALTADLRLAMRVFDSADASGNVIHFVSSSIDKWKTISGDGSPTDTGNQSIDLADLTDASNTTLLATAIVEIGGNPTFSPGKNSGLGSPNFVAIPEPSSFVLLLGAGGYLMLMNRRRS